MLKAFFVLIGFAIIGRLFTLQIVKHKEYLEIAERQQGKTLTVPSRRGTIYFQDKTGQLQAAALNREWPAVAAMPNIITDSALASSLISTTLGISASTTEPIFLKKSDPFEIIARKIPKEKADALDEAIRTTGIKGIQIFPEFRRFYPGETLGSNILGFVNFSNDVEVGQYGMERWFQDELSGKVGIFSSLKDAGGNFLFLGRKIIKPSEHGDSIVLTIDQNIQRKAEEEVERIRKKWNAVSGLFLIMDPMTGKIIAMGASPSFDPNVYSKEKDISVFKNPLIDSQYELGSIVKPVTMAAGINEKVVTPDTTYNDKGEVKIGTFTIKNYDLKAHGVQTMTQVLEKSLNTGVIFVENLLGKERFLSYLKKFGFGEKTGITFPGEARGNISNLNSMRDAEFATASFGQGIAVTPIQIATAVSAIANGGTLVQPHLVDMIKDDSGNSQKLEYPSKGTIISKEAAEAVTRMLVSTVQNGFDNHAGIAGYFVAGKTGTAQVPYKDRKGYDPTRAIHSFVGYAPAFKPKFLMFLQLIEPKGVNFASTSLTPAFHAIGEYMLNYYEVPMDIEPSTAAKIR